MLIFCNFGEWAIEQAAREGFDGIRCDESNGRTAAENVSLFVHQPMRPIFLLHDVTQSQPLLDALLPVQDHLLDPAIEIFNELEEGKVTEDIYVDGIAAVYHDARSRGFTGRIIAGGLMNLSRDSLDFYAHVLPRLPADRGLQGLTVGFHDYPYGTQQGPRKTWPGTGSPDKAIDTLVGLAKGRDIANTEVGWHTADEEDGFFVWKRTVRLTDEQAYDKLVTDLRRYDARGFIVLTVVFQWRDGGEDFRGQFGLHTADGQPKRQLDAVKDWRT